MAIRPSIDTLVKNDIPKGRIFITYAAGVPPPRSTLSRSGYNPHRDGGWVDADALVDRRLVVVSRKGIVEATVGIFVVTRCE